MLHRDDTKVRGRFSEKRSGPSRRCARNASAALENFLCFPQKTFSTVSVNRVGLAMYRRLPLRGDNRTFSPAGWHVSKVPDTEVGWLIRSPRRRGRGGRVGSSDQFP